MADVDISLDIDIKSFQKSIKNAQIALDGLGTSAKSAGESSSKGFTKANAAFDVFVGTLSSGIALKALNALGGAVSSFSTGAIDAASSIEDISAQFTTLTGSAESAKGLLEELTEFSATTPFQLEGIAEVSKSLLAFGFEQDSIVEKLKNLGDVAAASGSDLKDIGLIFGQISAAGKLTGERLLQLQERGVPIGKALADSMGVAESAVKDLVSAGEIGFDDFEKAFQSLAEEGGFAFNGMATQSQTLSGLISTLKDNFFLLQSEIGTALLPVLKTVVVQITEFIRANKELIAQKVQGFVEGAVGALSSMAEIFPIVSAGANLLKDTFDSMVDTVKLVAIAVPKLLGEGFNLALGSVQSLINGVSDLVKQLNVLPGVNIDFEPLNVEQFKADLTSIDSALSEIVEGTKKSDAEFKESLTSLADSLDQFNNKEVKDKKVKVEVELDSEKFSKDLKDATSKASTIKTPVPVVAADSTTFTGGGSTDALVGSLGTDSISAQIQDSLGPALDSFAGFGASAGKSLLKGLSASNPEEGARQLVTGTLAAATDLIFPGASQFAGPILDILSQGPDKVKEMVDGIAAAVPDIIDAIVQSIPVLVNSLAENLPTIIDNLAESLPDIIVALVKASPTIARALAEAMVIQIPSALAEALVETIQALIEEVLAPEFASIGDDARRSGKDFRESIQRGAVNLREGIASGINNFGAELSRIGTGFVESLKGAGTFLADSVKSAFDLQGVQEKLASIFSFDGVKEKINGAFSLEGVSDGISAKITGAFTDIDLKIVGAFTSAFDSAKTALTEVFSGLGDLFKIDTPDFGDIGKKISDGFGTALDAAFKPLKTFANVFIDIINGLKIPRLGYDFSVAGRNFSGTFIPETDLIPGNIARLQTGGFVQGSGARDTVPALLTPGELVIDRTTGPRLNRFLDNAEGGGVNSMEMLAVMSQILEAVKQPQAASVSLSVDGNVLADQILELTRNNARLGV